MSEKDIICVEPLTLQLDWEGGRLHSITLGWSCASLTPRVGTAWGDAFRVSLERYLDKKDPAWPEIPLAEQGLSDFALRILGRLRFLPFGASRSYGTLGSECGHPGAARAVGRVMARNPWPLLFPCHRVLGHSGHLTGFGPGLDLKRYLLNHEGIPCSSPRRFIG